MTEELKRRIDANKDIGRASIGYPVFHWNT